MRGTNLVPFHPANSLVPSLLIFFDGAYHQSPAAEREVPCCHQQRLYESPMLYVKAKAGPTVAFLLCSMTA